MQVFTMPEKLFTSVPRIGNIIPLKELTLLTGLAGTGKSYSLIKFLNQHNITPLYFNLDEDATIKQELNVFQGDPNWIKDILDLTVVDLKDEVVVIDTYQQLTSLLSSEGNTLKYQEWLTAALTKVARTCECAVIVIGHPEDYVGKDSIFKDNPSMVRNAYEHLHLDSILPRGKTKSDIVYRMFIKKGRGIGGTTMIDNWMR